MESTPRERNEYMRGAGFALAADVGHQFMAEMAAIEPEMVRHAGPWWSMIAAQPGANSNLYVITRHVREGMRSRQQDVSQDVQALYGVTGEDLDPARNKFLFGNGMADLDFTGHFASGLAAQVVSAMVSEGFVTEEAHEKMTLLDWADMIRSDWFRDMLHVLAKARNGQWGAVGMAITDYSAPTIQGRVNDNHGQEWIDRPFVFNKVFGADGYETITAAPSPEMRSALVLGMQNKGSSGCPVARHSGTLTAEHAGSDPHVQRLIAAGHIAITETFEQKGVQYIRYTQADSPIDKGAFVIANYLEEYSDRFGNPVINRTDGSMAHAPGKRTHPFRTGIVLPRLSGPVEASPGSIPAYTVTLKVTTEPLILPES